LKGNRYQSNVELNVTSPEENTQVKMARESRAARESGGAIAGFGKTRRRSTFSRFRASQTKRKAWGGREGDGKLTNRKKEGAGSPANPDDG
jgi:hypothetical protein